ncbi:hypothetical protein XMD509_000356 [Marinobacterium sp. xm-d-509]|nr:hypothetical protein [Marinobacterium sp. xm-g-48]NRP82110.1 hypothetical protein [Marinobacterium sp. xm-d-509]
MQTPNNSNRSLAARLLICTDRITGEASSDVDLVSTIERCLDLGISTKLVTDLLKLQDDTELVRLTKLYTH